VAGPNCGRRLFAVSGGKPGRRHERGIHRGRDRTPVGRRGGGLSGVHPADLGAHPIRALLERTGLDPAAIEDVIYGCIDAIGAQARDIARTCALVAGLPEHVPGVTVDRQCGSSQQAITFAAQAVMAGTVDLVIAGGVQNMSRTRSLAHSPRARVHHVSARGADPVWVLTAPIPATDYALGGAPGARLDCAKPRDALFAAPPDRVQDRQCLIVVESIGEEELEHAGVAQVKRHGFVTAQPFCERCPSRGGGLEHAPGPPACGSARPVTSPARPRRCRLG
jgi:hypothetical protein